MSSWVDWSADAARRLLIVTIAVTARPTTHTSRKSDGTGPTLAVVDSDAPGSHTSSTSSVALISELVLNVVSSKFMGAKPSRI